MLFNTQRPTTEAQLAQLYTGDPHLTPEQVQSDIFLGSARNAIYLQDQGRNLGIGDPVQYFSHQLAQQKMVDYQNGAGQRAAMQQSSMQKFYPGSAGPDPKELASLQMQGVDHNYPLPVPGMPTNLSPLMQQDMQAQGMQDPRAYLLNKRLQMMGASSVVQPFNQTSAPVNASELYGTPGFSRALQGAHPQQAAAAMYALTGHTLAATTADYSNNQDQVIKEGTTHFNKGFQSGHFKLNDQGIPLQQKYALNLQGAYTPTGDYEPLDKYSAGMWEQQPEVRRNVLGDKALRLQQLAKLGPPAVSRHARGISAIPANAPAAFHSPAFARLQKTDPAKANAFWLQWQQEHATPSMGADFLNAPLAHPAMLPQGF